MRQLDIRNRHQAAVKRFVWRWNVTLLRNVLLQHVPSLRQRVGMVTVLQSLKYATETTTARTVRTKPDAVRHNAANQTSSNVVTANAFLKRGAVMAKLTVKMALMRKTVLPYLRMPPVGMTSSSVEAVNVFRSRSNVILTPTVSMGRTK